MAGQGRVDQTLIVTIINIDIQAPGIG